VLAQRNLYNIENWLYAESSEDVGLISIMSVMVPEVSGTWFNGHDAFRPTLTHFEKITALHTCLSSFTHVGSNCSTISPVPKGLENYVCDKLLFSSVLPMLVGTEGPLGRVYRGTGTFLAFLIYSSFLWEIFL
jgi:hypothetical protein